MSIFSKHNAKHASNDSVMKLSRAKWLIIICAVVVIIGVAAVLNFVVWDSSANEPQKETRFIENPVQTVEDGEIITIHDPELGEIHIDAVEGFPKNTYDADNFKIDDNGLMTYYIDGQVASCMGVDLSDYQGDVDFASLKSQGISYVMLRIGGRYYSQKGGLYMDESFISNYNAAKEAGLEVGGYFFSQAKNAEEAQSEADYVLSNIKNLDLEYPIAFDWENITDDDARTDSVTGEKLTDCAIAFCDKIKAAGYHPLIYSNTYLTYYVYQLERLKDYDFWIADYETRPNMYYNFTMWQYSVDGKLEGIDTNVDLNICLKNF